MQRNLIISRGAEVMLLTNINCSLGLFDGSKGTVYDYIFSYQSSQIEWIIVQMDENYKGESLIEHIPRLVPFRRIKITKTNSKL